MKIVNLIEFKKLPPGTIFSKYEPCVFSDIMEKAGSMDTDFFYNSIINDVDNDSTGDFYDGCTAMENGESIPLEVDATSRDGMFDSSQLFAIYEKADVEQLVEKLSLCLKKAY